MRVDWANEIINDAIKMYNPKYIVAMFSGGHDSLVATHIASKHPAFSFACHINTGIGIEQTRAFVRNTCKEWGIELKEYKASEYINAKGQSDPQSLDRYALAHGFPGPAQHTRMYNSLKERPMSQMLRELDRKRTDKTMLISGLRQDESARRKRNTQAIQIDKGTRLWVAPIYNWKKRQVNEYITKHGLRRNLVADLLHSSGECLCGAYAHEGELEEIRQWYPEAAEQIDDLEKEVCKRFPWRWEQSPPSWYDNIKRGQLELFGEGYLCRSCMSKDHDNENITTQTSDKRL